MCFFDFTEVLLKLVCNSMNFEPGLEVILSKFPGVTKLGRAADSLQGRETLTNERTGQSRAI